MANNLSTFDTGSVAVAAAGTAEQLAAAGQRIPQGQSVLIMAFPSNTGYIYVGESLAQAQAHNIELGPGGSVAINVDNVWDVWVDCSVNGESVGWLVETPN